MITALSVSPVKGGIVVLKITTRRHGKILPAGLPASVRRGVTRLPVERGYYKDCGNVVGVYGGLYYRILG